MMEAIRDLVLAELAKAEWVATASPIDDDTIGIEAADGDRILITVAFP